MVQRRAFRIRDSAAAAADHDDENGRRVEDRAAVAVAARLSPPLACTRDDERGHAPRHRRRRDDEKRRESGDDERTPTAAALTRTAANNHASASSPPIHNRSSEFFVSSEKQRAPKSAKSTNRNRARNNADTYWLLFLILSGLSPPPATEKSLYTNVREGIMESRQRTSSSASHVRTLFDPMIGEFCADTSPQVLDKFFNSKLRWRDEHSWYQPIKSAAQQQQPSVNMLMTEQPPIIRPGPSANGLAQQNASNPAGGGQPSDPSLMDYEAIDVYWRRDIEMEKGMTSDFYTSLQYAGQGCSTSSSCASSSSSSQAACSTTAVDVSSEQFERDLQLLREKSLWAPLTHEENYRYENLSKAHYADFYRTVPTAAAKRWQQSANASSTSSTSGFSNQTAAEFRPPSPGKSNISNFDENEAENFFSTLAKESMLEENRPVQLPPPPPPAQQLQTYSNLTLCNDPTPVLNNVTLAHQANLPGVWANDTFFQPQQQQDANIGTRDSYEQQQERLEETAQPAHNNEDILEGVSAQPLEISDSETSEILRNLHASQDLNDAIELHEFIGMEMLGEFQRNASLCTDKRVDSPIPENVLSCVQAERETSPSSGIGSMQSSSSSPNRNEDQHSALEASSDLDYDYRFYGKLAPRVEHRVPVSSSSDDAGTFKRPQFRRPTSKAAGRNSAAPSGGVQQQRKRGRQSKDEQLAQEHGLPASAEEFAAMSHMEIQAYMRDPTLTPLQKNLIKKIRRRGRNKIAARKCRDRRNGQPGSALSQQTQQDNYGDADEMEDPSEMSLYEF